MQCVRHRTNFELTFRPWLRNGSIAAWFWGHEHSLGIYEPYAGLDKGRCIGCGAIPVFEANDPCETCAPRPGETPPQLVRRGDHPLILNTHTPPDLGEPIYNLGYVLLDFDGDTCVARYMECNAFDTAPTSS